MFLYYVVVVRPDGWIQYYRAGEKLLVAKEDLEMFLSFGPEEVFAARIVFRPAIPAMC